MESSSDTSQPCDRSAHAASTVSGADVFRRMVDSVSDYAIFALDSNGLIVTWNRGAQQIKGYARDEIIGRSFEVFYPKEAVDAKFPKYELEVAARDGRFEDEGWRVRKDGSRFWAHVVITALRDDAGRHIGFGKVTSDLSSRREAEEERVRGEQIFRLLVQAVKDYAILLLDPQGRIVSWNEGAERIKGYTSDEIIGRSFEVFYPEEIRASGFPRHELDTAAREGRFEDEGWRVRKDGTRFWANVIITSLYDTSGRLIGFAKVTRDLTVRREVEQQARQLAVEQAAHAAAAQRSEELRRLNDQLQTALADAQQARDAAQQSAALAEQAYRELDQFAYVASHDLKAPLRGIASLAEWIEEDVGERLSGESVNHMRLLRGRVQRMQALIDGILAYSRAGRALTAPERVETAALVREIAELQAIPPDVRIDVSQAMPVLQAERVPLQQVFMNLIGNAVKYTRAARPDPVITVTARETGDGCEFAIADNGPGIAPEFHERVWVMFQTLAPRDTIEGTGIGLSVVKKIVESRGGCVSLESAPGQGATFRFTWPAAPTPGART